MITECKVVESVSIYELSSSWSDHLKDRIVDAFKIGMINSSDWLEQAAATVLLPKVTQDIRGALQPETSVRNVIGDSHVAGQWIERPDLLPNASSVVSNSYGGISHYLICEAGYSKVGDKSLSRFESFSHEGSPFIYVEITGSNCLEVEVLLKAARGFRLLGLILEASCVRDDFGGRKIAFLCDALDGDSIIICPGK
ncbi:hypothetical protein [Pseudomonas viridiflava]|uniref:hypothetical protein n=1 Tax=Pseudomonas viridiflava TaxID=33069 RepID=UPI00117A1B7B|nr:hypothetical protein [Pseudomonas viridiflava]MEE4719033.1 hypothetical protein [Pseudomonas alliivorans]MEE4723998.1 hypothetical protein [Pseudomonas alliivorans]MEE4760055.1 hypothetical protein [Pseudomonas alliivorans]MEE4765205.1 hypothetical protein [Pseudomonas alliivorans]MEE4775340.1 hypothetical protein [Pseudomonas alliivorans]